MKALYTLCRSLVCAFHLAFSHVLFTRQSEAVRFFYLYLFMKFQKTELKHNIMACLCLCGTNYVCHSRCNWDLHYFVHTWVLLQPRLSHKFRQNCEELAYLYHTDQAWPQSSITTSSGGYRLLTLSNYYLLYLYLFRSGSKIPLKNATTTTLLLIK